MSVTTTTSSDCISAAAATTITPHSIGATTLASNSKPHLVNRWASKDRLYNYEKVIHEGHYGTTLQARRGKFGPRLAILLFHLPWASTVRDGKFQKFVGFHHKNIVKILESFDCYDPPLSNMSKTQFATLPPPTAVAIVMEFSISGTLSMYLSKYSVNEETRLRWYCDLATGLQYLHMHRILHWDLHPDNIWIQDDQLKIANIGFVQIARESNQRLNLSYGELIKTHMTQCLPFIAPEAYKGMYYGSSEIFSLALICLTIAESPDSGHHQAKWSDTVDYLGPLLSSNIPPRSMKPIHLLEPPVYCIRPQESNLFNQMLNYDCSLRPDIDMILSTLQTMKPGGGESVIHTAYKWLCYC